MTLEDIISAIDMDWRVAHMSSTKHDAEFRWNRMGWQIDGIWCLVNQLTVGHSNRYELLDALTYLKTLARYHEMSASRFEEAA